MVHLKIINNNNETLHKINLESHKIMRLYIMHIPFPPSLQIFHKIIIYYIIIFVLLKMNPYVSYKWHITAGSACQCEETFCYIIINIYDVMTKINPRPRSMNKWSVTLFNAYPYLYLYFINHDWLLYYIQQFCFKTKKTIIRRTYLYNTNYTYISKLTL